MDRICDKEMCTGCGLCENICPVHAISMKPQDGLGHKRPIINAELCVDCELCAKKCPVNNDVAKVKSKKCFAAWQVNDDKHYSSSSGGIAAALYETAIKEGAWIVGVKEGKNLEPVFILSNKEEQINEFKGSKYVQPATNLIYKEVAEKLDKGNKVIFIGLPCHCAAMKRYAENTRNGELVLVDLVCHGVPSFKTLKEHIEYLEKSLKRSSTQVKFRDKDAGECLELIDRNDSFYKRNLHEDVYMHSFISGDLFNENCYHCKYASQERVGDLTLCDFWGIGKLDPFNHKVRRVSAVLINTDKGEKEFEKIKKLIYSEQRQIQEAIDGNSQLQHPPLKGDNREPFIKYAKNDDVERGLYKIYGKYCDKNFRKRAIKNKIKSILKSF